VVLLLCAALFLAPRVQLVTMGENETLYARFGHTALRVTDGPNDLVYNFGTTDFSRPHLVTDFMRGHVKFWVSVSSWSRTLEFYREEDRSIWLQDLHLTPTQHQALADRLRWQALPEHREYDYDHFSDNCSTRVRDLIDEAAGGRLRAALSVPYPLTIRELALTGFPGMVAMQIGTDLLLGRSVDRPITRWEAAFLPRLLRESLPLATADDGAPLGSAPTLLYRRRGPEVVSGQPAYTGRYLLVATAAALLLAAGLGMRRPRLTRGLRIGWGIAGGLAGSFLWALAAYSTLPLLRQNPNLLLLWPLDLVLIGAGPQLAFRYGVFRLLVVWLVFVVVHPPSPIFAVALSGLLAATSHELFERLRRRLAGPDH
jgi:hypothetical protein